MEGLGPCLVPTKWGLHFGGAYESYAGSDPVCLSADLFLTLTNRGQICHSNIFWPIEKQIMI